jgi:hypothetical protein
VTLAVPHIVRNWQMQQALERGLERLQPCAARPEALSIVGYGPSILQTWKELSYPILSLSGAHSFLLERGIKPDFHADCDPRIHKSDFVKHPSRQTVYLMASCCHPRTWEYLEHEAVRIWHADNGPETLAWLETNEPNAGVVTFRPGPSIGTAALGLARALGFRRVRLFGFDSCFVEGELRAGASGAPHPLDERPIVLTVGGVTYLTTENMRLQAEAFAEHVRGLEYELVGNGLLKAMLRLESETA